MAQLKCSHGATATALRAIKHPRLQQSEITVKIIPSEWVLKTQIPLFVEFVFDSFQFDILF